MAATRRRTEEGYERFLAYLGDVGLGELVRSVCLAHAVTPRDAYMDSRSGSAFAARLELWWRLQKQWHKSHIEIGRLFDRKPTSVTHAMRKLYRHAEDAMRTDLDANSARVVARAFVAALAARRRRGEPEPEVGPVSAVGDLKGPEELGGGRAGNDVLTVWERDK